MNGGENDEEIRLSFGLLLLCPWPDGIYYWLQGKGGRVNGSSNGRDSSCSREINAIWSKCYIIGTGSSLRQILRGFLNGEGGG